MKEKVEGKLRKKYRLGKKESDSLQKKLTERSEGNEYDQFLVNDTCINALQVPSYGLP